MISLEDKYVLEEGEIFLTGVQGLVRLLLDQHRADARAGLHTATFISGYEGSPLGGLDQELARRRRLAEENEIVHRPGVNEELGATAAWGSQLAIGVGGAPYDGIISAWYGKAPGLDRATDAIRHGNWVGVGPSSGAVAMVGDDPSSKSSTLPSASELALADLGMPTFYPGSVQDVLDLGLHAIACSRASGLWSAMKMVTNVADSSATVSVAPGRVSPVLDGVERVTHTPHAHLLAPQTLELERSLVGPRLQAARQYAVRNGLFARLVDPPDAWLGIVAAGKPYYDLQEALRLLGLSGPDLARMGVRVLKPGMIFPLDRAALRDFADGLAEILVVEEKRPFLEVQLKEALYGTHSAPLVTGKEDQEGNELLPAAGELEPHRLAEVVLGRLGARIDVDPMAERLDRLRALERRKAPVLMGRTPFFCSGCPHNRSTDAPDGTLVGAGTGCHSMVMLNGTDKGEVSALTQMGGEGAQWVGVAPFSDRTHFTQNMGDGTYHHSGALSIRQAIASNLDVTFKIYYNQAVAMTGGQAVPAALSVPALTRVLEQEGVARTVVTSDAPDQYGRGALAANAAVRDRTEIVAAQEELADVPGVTVLLHDQQCAAEKRRLRKRGRLDDPDRRVVINERVCEGCGDCGRVSDCLSVRPVETEFGRKTQIHQPSCNKDYSCLEGDCPSFVTVTNTRKRPPSGPPDAELPEPVLPAAEEFRVRMTGIGGTGVTTISQVLGTAALLDGRESLGLDQTGLAQKGGPVVSDLLVARSRPEASAKAPLGGVDLYLALDVLTALQGKNLAGCSPEKTAAIYSTATVATGEMVVDVDAAFPPGEFISARLGEFCDRDGLHPVPAEELALTLFDDDLPANVIMVGAAYQAGLLPLSGTAIEGAFRLNGVAVEVNLAAFAWGRACMAAPELVERVLAGGASEAESAVETPDWCGPLLAAVGGDQDLRHDVALRLVELEAYQDRAYARLYAERVAAARGRSEALDPELTIAHAYARNLFKLMAYKDEYEVARLHLLEAEQAKLRAEFGDQVRVHWHLHPPFLRALGMRRKLVLGEWFRPFFGTLRALRRLRGTPFDPFGRTHVRKVERRLVEEYEEWVEGALGRLDRGLVADVLEICELPDSIRGYENIKLEAVESARRRAGRLRQRLDREDQLPVERVAGKATR